MVQPSFIAVLVAAGAVSFSRRVELGPVQMTYQDFAGLITTARGLIAAADPGATVPNINESIEATQGGTQISFTPDAELSQLKQAPASAEYVRYQFIRSGEPIALLEITFADSERTIKVGGSSQQHVNALLNAIESQVAARTVTFGGSNRRIILGVVVVLIGLGFMAVGFVPDKDFDPNNRHDVWVKARQGRLMFVGGLMVLSMLVLPWRRFFPGATILASDAPFYARYAAEIGLVGTLLAVVAFFQSVFRRKDKPAPTETPPTSPPATPL